MSVIGKNQYLLIFPKMSRVFGYFQKNVRDPRSQVLETLHPTPIQLGLIVTDSPLTDSSSVVTPSSPIMVTSHPNLHATDRRVQPRESRNISQHIPNGSVTKNLMT